ncbi:phosphoenolpyruvate carboxykinase (ATP) [Alkalicoccus daliensis]|uniref:Phosphoenolpyruvate carboxykinase (ATP) n=1 Tax=Alkalicoccus daliensis TaxID=745820 RepID=A0A1H0HFG0_9BACI|nr:phosphoenolpyruvate carboxykinase (ATP) [Alkalicoccus daliensis]SDO17830.1 phosphoenolpyruvate carboxykinase (ATP) [Alkalicoccus daliensis]
MREMTVMNKEKTFTAKKMHKNLSVPELMEQAITRKEAVLTESGALDAFTGEFTGRSPQDKYIVADSFTKEKVKWGKVNQQMRPETFASLYQKALDYMAERELFMFEGAAGADPAHQLSIRVVNELAWHNLFVKQLFIDGEADRQEPGFTVICLPGLKADPEEDQLHSETFIAISFEKKTVLIGGTAYAGEMKKSVFSVLNFLLPPENVLPMHCSANSGKSAEDTALFFGLSGTGKTTLSADPERNLIGDDEHGWSDNGVFNFEGGCYAKCIGLSPEKEPQIWKAIQYGSVLENVAMEKETRTLDFNDNKHTENTRAAYSIEKITGAVTPSMGGHPNVIIFLTADAFGVLPPISKLTKEQAMYHFLSGYTSKLAGTERGVSSPEATFSACFGEPFLPLKPSVYAEMLGKKIDQHEVRVYLVNTGWSGGPYGVGERIKLAYTRTMVKAAVKGELENTSYKQEPVFGLYVPDEIAEVPTEILHPRDAWEDGAAYDKKAKELAQRFTANFDRFTHQLPEIKEAGPKL